MSQQDKDTVRAFYDAIDKALTLFTFADGRIANELVIVDRGMPGA